MKMRMIPTLYRKNPNVILTVQFSILGDILAPRAAKFIAGLNTFSSCHRHEGVTFLNKTLVPLRNLVQTISLVYHARTFFVYNLYISDLIFS